MSFSVVDGRSMTEVDMAIVGAGSAGAALAGHAARAGESWTALNRNDCRWIYLMSACDARPPWPFANLFGGNIQRARGWSLGSQPTAAM